jgi:ketosteroid isomerase-like protein
MYFGICTRNDIARVGRGGLTAATRCLAIALVVWVGSTVWAQDSDAQHVAAARAALDEYFRAWNAGDNDAVAAISNYPRLSLGENGQVVVRETPEAIATDFDALRQSGWDHSTLDLVEAVHVSGDKVHFRIVFSRYGADGTPYTTAPGLYVMTNQNGHWGLQLQSILPSTFTR